MPPTKLPDLPLTEKQKLLCESNIKLVYWAVKKYLPGVRGEAYQDAVLHVQVGLVRASQLFDPKRGFKFGTYANWWLWRSACEWSKAQRNKRECLAFSEMGCMSAGIHSGQSLPFEPVDDARDAGSELRDLLGEIRRFVSKRQWLVLEMRYIEECTLQEVGDRMGLTKERVRQIEKRAKQRVRNCCGQMAEA